jgi:hypothetical protein
MQLPLVLFPRFKLISSLVIVHQKLVRINHGDIRSIGVSPMDETLAIKIMLVHSMAIAFDLLFDMVVNGRTASSGF